MFIRYFLERTICCIVSRRRMYVGFFAAPTIDPAFAMYFSMTGMVRAAVSASGGVASGLSWLAGVAEGEAGEMGAPGVEATPARPNIASMSSRMVRRRFSFSLVVSSSFCFFATVSNSGRGAMLGSSSSTRSRGQGIPLISLRAVPR